MSRVTHSFRSAAKTISGGAATAVMMAIAAAPAHAASTSTPDGGPALNFVGTNISLTDVTVNETFTCSQFDMAGGLYDPGVGRAYGVPSGAIQDITRNDCTHPIFGTAEIAQTGTWHVAITGDEDQDGWPVTLTDLTADVETGQCFFEIDGEVSGHFDESTQVFAPESSTVHISSVPHGLICGILGFQEGDGIDVGGHWTNIPPSASTGLAITNP